MSSMSTFLPRGFGYRVFGRSPISDSSSRGCFSRSKVDEGDDNRPSLNDASNRSSSPAVVKSHDCHFGIRDSRRACPFSSPSLRSRAPEGPKSYRLRREYKAFLGRLNMFNNSLSCYETIVIGNARKVERIFLSRGSHSSYPKRQCPPCPVPDMARSIFVLYDRRSKARLSADKHFQQVHNGKRDRASKPFGRHPRKATNHNVDWMTAHDRRGRIAAIGSRRQSWA